jgi:hypothetical protein
VPLPEPPPGPVVVIVTVTLLAGPAGETTVSWVVLITFTPVPELPPKVTVVAPRVILKFVPMIVTVVPPDIGPLFGVIEVIDGLAAETGPTMASRRITAMQNSIRNGIRRFIIHTYQ